MQSQLKTKDKRQKEKGKGKYGEYFLCDLCEKLCGLCGSGFGLNKVTESMLFT
jgi:hypothetical protein